MQHFKTLSEYLAYVQLPQPEHPMLTILSSKGNQYLSCPIESTPPISNDCYVISLKKVIKGNVNYGRTKYDATNGAMIFLAPRQVIQWTKEIVIKQQGFLIMFHEDYLNGTALAQQIREYGFFSYTANEALHLSPNEERQIQVITDSIESEYHNNQDAFSKDIIISQLSTLLKYANRFYDRQFINRRELSAGLLLRFNRQLEEYFKSGKLKTSGIPSIEIIANQLSISQRYLSDSLKKQTGKTTTEHLQLFLINKAKDILLQPDKSISEVAYELGFEYPQYFSRLFKKKEGISPSVFREKYALR